MIVLTFMWWKKKTWTYVQKLSWNSISNFVLHFFLCSEYNVHFLSYRGTKRRVLFYWWFLRLLINQAYVCTYTIWPAARQNKQMTCAPSEDSDQPEHPPSLSAWRNIGSLASYWAHSKDSDQTRQMRRLIWVIATRTCQVVGFVRLWLNYGIIICLELQDRRVHWA